MIDTNERFADDLTGVIDLYVHASPDLLPRESGDIDLAREGFEAGYRAMLHRNHFSITTERGAVASSAVGFDLLGAVLLNDYVGGLDPVVTETALRGGARWVGMPTLSAAAFRMRLPAESPHSEVLRLGRGDIALIDGEGKLKLEVHEILDLAAAADVPVGIGYGTQAECNALWHGASDAGVDKLVLTYPDVIGLTDEAIIEFAGRPGVYLELCALTLHPRGLTPSLASPLQRRVLHWLGALGSEKVVASSDGGMVGTPGVTDLMCWLIGWLGASGVNRTAIDLMVRSNAARLLSI